MFITWKQKKLHTISLWVLNNYYRSNAISIMDNSLNKLIDVVGNGSRVTLELSSSIFGANTQMYPHALFSANM